MSINLDDPDLTAYALGELSEPKRSAMELAVAASPEAQAHVHEVREFAALLKGEFDRHLSDGAKKPLSILPLPQEQTFWSDARWGSLAVAALLAMAAVVGAVLLSGVLPGGDRKVARRETILQMEVDSARINLPPATRPAPSYRRFDENQFVAAAVHPVSTIPIDIDAASYVNVRRSIDAGRLPPKEAVQIEGMINYFTYDYPQPEGERVFAIVADAATCPWRPEHHLVRIGLKGREDGAARIIAKDVKLEVEFDPARVESYRLIGYETRMNRGGGRDDGEAITAEIRSGHSVTALYEVVPAPASRVLDTTTMLTVKLSHREPDGGAAEPARQTLEGAVQDFANAPADFKFAAAVAEFGMVLRASPHSETASVRSAIASAEAGRGGDATGDRARFIELARKAQALLAGSG